MSISRCRPWGQQFSCCFFDPWTKSASVIDGFAHLLQGDLRGIRKISRLVDGDIIRESCPVTTVGVDWCHVE